MSDPHRESARLRPLRVRFAPSPTGALHLGNARTALFNWIVARQSGGTLVLRIEDTDVDRHLQGAEAAILEDLRWLGLDWDEGPDVGGPHAPYRQSERGDGYREAAAALLSAGRAYRCFCSAGRLEADRKVAFSAGRQPHYPGRCRGIAPDEAQRRADAGEPFVLRFDVGSDGAAPGTSIRFRDRLRGWIEVDRREVGDPVLVRRDGRPTYNFAVCVDDAAMGIDLVLRGDDHLSNTPRQVLLFEAMDFTVPEFAHLPTVRAEDGGKLSKRHGAVSLAEYRRRGYVREGVLNALVLLGWAPSDDRQVLGVGEILREFDLDRVHRAAARFDPARLDWLSAQHLQRYEPSALAPELGRRLIEAGFLAAADLSPLEDWLAEVADLVRHSVSRLDEAPERCAGLFAAGGRPASGEGRAALHERESALVLETLAQVLAESAAPADLESWLALKQSVKERCGVKGRKLFHPIRLAITGQDSGPELDRLVPLVVRGGRIAPQRVPALESRLGRTREWILESSP